MSRKVGTKTASRGTRRRRVERFLIREVQPRDLDPMYALSAHLNSVNFPHDRTILRRIIQRARRTFSGQVLDPWDRVYLFVLEGVESKRLAGTSMVFGQHGHAEAPHIYFDVFQDERYSTTLDRHFTHTTLRLGFNYNGPTEIGALVLDPKLRAHGLGRPLSFVRFLFIAMFRAFFRDEVIAELMPPLTKDGRSELWDHVGARFTGLSYQEADKLSHTNKEFIVSLFPQAIHATLLPDHVADLIGRVGEDTKAVERMLQKIGFRYRNRIDPFDGGPHFHAGTDEITVVQNARPYALSKARIDPDDERRVLAREPVDGLEPRLVAAARREGPSKFRSLVCATRVDGDELVLSAESKKLLSATNGGEVWAVGS